MYTIAPPTPHFAKLLFLRKALPSTWVPLYPTLPLGPNCPKLQFGPPGEGSQVLTVLSFLLPFFIFIIIFILIAPATGGDPPLPPHKTLPGINQ